MRTLYEGETYSQEIDSVNNESVTVFKRDGVTVDTAGEFCGEYNDAREARVVINRLGRISEVMES
jgi:Tfp pilus assembly protein FimT